MPVSKIRFQSPFPNVLEAVRFIADLLDLKFQSDDKSALDDKAVERYVDPRQVDILLGDLLRDKLDRLLDQNEAAIFYSLITGSFLRYLKLVSTIDVTGLNRAEVIEILYRDFAPPVLFSFLIVLEKYLDGPSPLVVLRSHTGFSSMLDTITKTEVHWNDYWAALPKPKKDYYRKWKSADNLVSYESLKCIHEVEGSNGTFDINWSCVRALLLCGRAIDRFTQMTKGREEKAIQEQGSFGKTPISKTPDCFIKYCSSNLAGNPPLITGLKSRFATRPLWPAFGWR